jgi:hypothetical protein
MGKPLSILVLSDVHYASEAEKARGSLDLVVVDNPLLRLAVKMYRHYIWRRDPFAHNYLLDRFVAEAGSPDYVFANGDLSCDTAYIGVSDPAACQSAEECLAKLHGAFGDRLHNSIGDHELGKMSLFGGRGGMRLASLRQANERLQLPPFWQLEIGRYIVIGVTSSMLAFPVYEPEALLEEIPQWQELRREHLALIRGAFGSLKPEQRVILFCHDPTALPFLWSDELIRSRLHQISHTIIGHLHSELFMWKSGLLAGMPTIRFLGNSIRRMSAALHDARIWKSFNVRLCPSLGGIQLLKDGGYFELELDPDARLPVKFNLRQLPWNRS